LTAFKKKLIEVALPLEAINKESAREKSIRHGHPSTLHLWWSRKPLSTCRAVLFASLVDDPSSRPEEFPTPEAQERERQRLFRILEQLVKWENSNNEEVPSAARREIERSTGGKPPVVLDPFCGGGSIPLEAQRLGLEVQASDLNPVAVLITKALVEIPPKFAGRPPVHPGQEVELHDRRWNGAQGLAEDVRFYGEWMRAEAEKRIGHLYPKVKLPKEKGGGEATVIAWLWVRSVRCPNPACGIDMPLASKFWLSKRKGKETWVLPVVDGARKEVRFEVREGPPGPPEGTVNRRGARCIACGTPVPFAHIRKEGQAGRMHAQLMAIVAEGHRGRVYVEPVAEHIEVANSADPSWAPDASLPVNPRDFKTPNYGMRTFADLFTPRQLVALTTFSDLVREAREKVKADAVAAGLADDPTPLAEGGTGAQAYADAIATYLAFAVDRLADRNSTICTWDVTRDNVRNTFARQALPMTWDFAEANPFSESTGNFLGAVQWIAEVLSALEPNAPGACSKRDAVSSLDGKDAIAVCTDPPYYDNIGYADLSDYFYIWLRRSLGNTDSSLFSTVLTPKGEELVATPYRFGGDKRKAEEFFEKGLREVFKKLRAAQDQRFPLTLFYAFKQAERKGDGAHVSTGWETMLEGLVASGFRITGTWPMRSELQNRPVAHETNALASSIVLVCRPRPEDAPRTTRKEFLAELKRELPRAIRELQKGNIAPVDLAQAAIGPGMAVFSRYAAVLEADGKPMRVRTALALINQTLDEILAEQEAEFDPDTRWALAWFEQYNLREAPYGVAETLSKAKNTSVEGLVRAGILQSGGGKVRLLRRDELDEDWDPTTDDRLTVWEIAHHMIRALETKGERGAAEIYRKAGAALAENARDLAYRLYQICERKGLAQEARGYNALVVSWPAILETARQMETPRVESGELDFGG
jgi:putative DNA methylase